MILDMNKLTEELKKNPLLPKVNYFNSGGNCGTIYLGEADKEGMYQFAIGPSNYENGLVEIDAVAFGVDGEEEANYFNLDQVTDKLLDFLPQVCAEIIAHHYQIQWGRIWH